LHARGAPAGSTPGGRHALSVQCIGDPPQADAPLAHVGDSLSQRRRKAGKARASARRASRLWLALGAFDLAQHCHHTSPYRRRRIEADVDRDQISGRRREPVEQRDELAQRASHGREAPYQQR
jgi:hypothetical protein